MEIRIFGAPFKTWNQILLDLDQLGNWLQAAFRQA